MRYLLFLLIGILAVGTLAGTAWSKHSTSMVPPRACTGTVVTWSNGASEPIVMVYSVSVTGGSAWFKYLDGRKRQFAMRKIKFQTVRIARDSSTHFWVSTRIGGIYGDGVLPAGDTLFLGLAKGDTLAMDFTRREKGLYALYFNSTSLGYCMPAA